MSRLETNDLGYLIWDVPIEVASTSSKFGVTIVYTIKKLPQLLRLNTLKYVNSKINLPYTSDIALGLLNILMLTEHIKPKPRAKYNISRMV